MIREWRNRMPLLAIRFWLIILLALLLLIQILFSFFLEDLATIEFYYQVGLNRDTFLEGQVWGLFTYSFFHHPETWNHLILNALCLFYLSGRITHILGSAACLKILGLGIISAGIFHLLLDPFFRLTLAPLIGISGGVCALLAALCTIAPDSKFFPFMVSGKNLLRASLISTVFFLLISPKLNLPPFTEIGDLLSSTILKSIFTVGHICHLGGLISGIICTRWLIRPARLL